MNKALSRASKNKMPSAVIPSPRAASADRDDLDNLFNYDDAVDDFLKDLNPNADSNGNDDSGNARGGLDTSKDMDEEIKVTRRRAPAPKLDDNRYAMVTARQPPTVCKADLFMQHSLPSRNTQASSHKQNPPQVPWQGT